MKNKFNFQAVIWDLDGTISDTQDFHAQVQSDVLKKYYNINMTPDKLTKRFAGIPSHKIFKQIFEENNIKANYLKAEKLKWKIFSKGLKNKKLEALPGVINLIKKLKKDKIKLAVASSSPKKYVRYVLRRLKILNYFSVVTSGDEVTNGKPHPDIFNLVAKKLKIKNEFCIVIEDGTAGIIAGPSANMKCRGVGDDIDKSILKKTSTIISTLEKIEPEDLEKLFNQSLIL